ncbi:MAG: hypothetical protein H6683_06165 [Deltaproteobacteria bacterium]|nr:hypothetical protein [Deltaproteobacteria bacterium]
MSMERARGLWWTAFLLPVMGLVIFAPSCGGDDDDETASRQASDDDDDSVDVDDDTSDDDAADDDADSGVEGSCIRAFDALFDCDGALAGYDEDEAFDACVVMHADMECVWACYKDQPDSLVCGDYRGCIAEECPDAEGRGDADCEAAVEMFLDCGGEISGNTPEGVVDKCINNEANFGCWADAYNRTSDGGTCDEFFDNFSDAC